MTPTTVPLPAPDAALPCLPTLLDAASMTELLAGEAKPGAVRDCRPMYIRYKPDTSALIQYALTLRLHDGTGVTVPATVRVFADDRARARLDRGRTRRLVKRAFGDGSSLPLPPVRYLEAVNGLFQLYPIDLSLPELARVAAASGAGKMLGRAGLGGGRVEVTAEPELIRYKPERKALLRYDLTNGPVERLYGKVLTTQDVEALSGWTDALIAAGVPTPPVLATVPKRRFIAHAEVPGRQLASLRGEDAYAGWMPHLAAALNRMHATELPGLTPHPVAMDIDAIVATTRLLSRVAPHLAARMEALRDGIVSRLAEVPPRFATSHGDFYDDQALVNSDVTLIDLDELCLAHPLLDIGNMLAHLTIGEARGDDVARAREIFTTEATRGSDFTGADIALHEAGALFRLAPGPFRRLEADWPEGIERILDLAEARLAEVPAPQSPLFNRVPTSRRECVGSRTPQGVRPADRRSADPPMATNDDPSDVVSRGVPGRDFSLSDPALPQLGTLQDPFAMSAKLTAAFDDRSVSVAGIDVVRHKPGRRAILRYEVHRAGHGSRDHAGPRDWLYGKTFASNRGQRVVEITRAITDARAFGDDITLPEPIAFLPAEKLLVQRAVAGEPIEASLRAGGEGARTMAERVADAICRLHAADIDLGRRHDAEREVAPLADRAAQVAAACPDLTDLARDCLARIQAVVPDTLPWRRRPVHRDFYHDQVLEHDGDLAVLDLDDAAMSEPAVDIANFAAHLMLLGAQRSGDIHALDGVRHAFTARCHALDQDLDPALRDWLTATTLLRLSGIHFGRDNGPAIARMLLEKSAALLETSEPLLNRVKTTRAM